MIQRTLFAALMCLVLLPAPLAAQVVHDGEANVTVALTPAGTSITLTGKTTAGSNRIGVVGCAVGASVTVTADTWNGVTMGAAKVSATNGTDGRQAMLWWIANPPTAASDIVITFSGSITAVCTASSYNGAHQTVQTGATNTASGTASPATVDCTPNTNEMIVDQLYFLGAGTAPAVGADQTSNGSSDEGSWFGSSSRQAAASGATMSWTLTSPTRWTTVCAAFQPAGAAAAACQRSLLGVGCE